jgi:PAS domain-containing protein
MGEYRYTHDYTAEIETLRQEAVALPYRASGDASSPSGLDEAIEAVAVALQALHAANETLIQTQQVALHEQQRYRVLFTFAPDSYLVTDLHGFIQEANQAAASLPDLSSADSSALRLVVQEVLHSIYEEGKLT